MSVYVIFTAKYLKLLRNAKSARQRLLKSSWNLFNKEGLSVGIDRIIKEAGVAKMSFYSHFPSKKDLVLEYLRIRDEQWFELLEFYINEVEEPREKILSIFDALADWFGQENFFGCPFVSGLSEVDDEENPNAAQCIGEHFQRTSELVGGLVELAGYKEKDELTAKICLLIVGAIVVAQASNSIDPADVGQEAAEQLLDAAEKQV